MTFESADDPRKLVYPETYFVGLAPQEMRLALLSRGISAPSSESIRYLELGFGSGFSLNVHAAANMGEFWGNDFVRAHADGAASLASITGADAHFLPDSFADLLTRDDLPEFDIIAAHGIWTWVPDDDRAAIVELLRRKLAPGGVFYVSYNNTAGWSSVVFLRQMMKLYLAESGGRAGISDAIAFARQLNAAGATYFKENPTAVAELGAMAGRNPVYLQQEYFLDDWKLMSLAEIASALAPAGLQFGAQFPLITHDDDLVLGQRGREMLARVESDLLRETVRESFQGMGFRQDLFVRAPVRLTAAERREQFRRLPFVLMIQPHKVMLKGGSPWGELDLAAKGCVPVMNAIAELGEGPHALADVEALLPAVAIDDLISRIVLLAAVNVVRPAFAAGRRTLVEQRCAALNAHILGLRGAAGAMLASPVLGAGVEITALERALVRACAAGRETVQELAEELAQSCAAELGGRNAHQVASALLADHLPLLRSVGLMPA